MDKDTSQVLLVYCDKSYKELQSMLKELTDEQLERKFTVLIRKDADTLIKRSTLTINTTGCNNRAVVLEI
jgi:hypothetical protein